MKTKRTINVIKIGNMVKISLDGKLHQKNCGNAEEAKELFTLILKAKEDPSDENVKNVRGYLNEKLRIAILTGLESDVETGEVFLAGFNTPIPATLLDVIKDYHENGYPLTPIINFWKLLMLNPDTRVRTVLFDFITTHDFSLTDAGYMIVYKAVNVVKDAEEPKDTSFAEFVSKQFYHVKKDWKCSPNKYVAYKNLEDESFNISKVETVEKWDEQEKNVEVLGKLGELFDAIFNTDIEAETDVKIHTPVYTDMHTKKMRIELGTPVQQDRKLCDADFRNDCSNGLHVGATKYVENFAGRDGAILVCYVNPTNVVAVPDYDHSKMRVSEYFPFAIANYNDRKIDIVEQKYFESDYCDYEIEELDKMVLKLQAEEMPLETAMKAEAETRPMSELLKIIESRIIDLN